MIKPALDDEDEKPLDPAVENVRRKLVRFVGINLALLFLALMAVVAAIVYKSRTQGPAPAAISASEIPTNPPPGGFLEGDIALTLGAIMKRDMKIESEVLAIDGVTSRDFDYVDIGRLRMPSHTVPVTIKSLVFPGVGARATTA